MNSLTISVPPEQSDAIDSWEDGKTYNLVVTQTGAGKFELESSEEAAEPAKEESEPSSEGDESGQPMSKNPAIVMMIGKKK